jgi:hypothetical protein
VLSTFASECNFTAELYWAVVLSRTCMECHQTMVFHIGPLFAYTIFESINIAVWTCIASACQILGRAQAPSFSLSMGSASHALV